MSVICRIRAALDGLRCCFEATLVGVQRHLLWGLWPHGKGRFGGRIAAKKCSCKLWPNRHRHPMRPPSEYKEGVG